MCTLAPTHDSGKCRRLLFDHRAHVGGRKMLSRRGL